MAVGSNTTYSVFTNFVTLDFKAFAAPHEVGHPLVIFKGEVHSVAGGLPERVHVMESAGPVVAFSAFKPGGGDVGAGQELPGGREVFLDPQQVMPGRWSRYRTSAR